MGQCEARSAAAILNYLYPQVVPPEEAAARIETQYLKAVAGAAIARVTSILGPTNIKGVFTPLFEFASDNGTSYTLYPHNDPTSQSRRLVGVMQEKVGDGDTEQMIEVAAAVTVDEEGISALSLLTSDYSLVVTDLHDRPDIRLTGLKISDKPLPIKVMPGDHNTNSAFFNLGIQPIVQTS